MSSLGFIEVNRLAQGHCLLVDHANAHGQVQCFIPDDVSNIPGTQGGARGITAPFGSTLEQSVGLFLAHRLIRVFFSDLPD